MSLDIKKLLTHVGPENTCATSHSSTCGHCFKRIKQAIDAEIKRAYGDGYEDGKKAEKLRANMPVWEDNFN